MEHSTKHTVNWDRKKSINLRKTRKAWAENNHNNVRKIKTRKFFGTQFHYSAAWSSRGALAQKLVDQNHPRHLAPAQFVWWEAVGLQSEGRLQITGRHASNLGGAGLWGGGGALGVDNHCAELHTRLWLEVCENNGLVGNAGHRQRRSIPSVA